MGIRDGEAVRVARGAISRQESGSVADWRSTVVSEKDCWTVRTWTKVRANARRPEGPPDFVHRVVKVNNELVAGQVHPQLAIEGDMT